MENTTANNGEKSVALRLMQSMGWSEGKGLGKEESGITEALGSSRKFNTKGFGYKYDASGDWVKHQEDFESLLRNLNPNSEETPKEKSFTPSQISERSQQQRGRHLFYSRLIRGKDLSRRSEADIKAIIVPLGRDRKTEEPEPEEVKPEKDYYNDGVSTAFKSVCSSTEYFSQKLKERQQRFDNSGNMGRKRKHSESHSILPDENNYMERRGFGFSNDRPDNVADNTSRSVAKNQIESNNNYIKFTKEDGGHVGDAGHNEPTVDNHAEFDQKQKKKKKKKGKTVAENHEELQSSVVIPSENGQEIVTDGNCLERKKKKKQKETLNEELHSSIVIPSENGLQIDDDCLGGKKKKDKKKQKCHQQPVEVDGVQNDQVCSNGVVKKHKKKKSINENVISTVEPIIETRESELGAVVNNEEVEAKSKKKKKHKNQTENDDQRASEDISKEILIPENSTHETRKKKKQKSTTDEGISAETSCDVLCDELLSRKGKKKRKAKLDATLTFSVNQEVAEEPVQSNSHSIEDSVVTQSQKDAELDDSKHIAVVQKKKKKKRREDETASNEIEIVEVPDTRLTTDKVEVLNENLVENDDKSALSECNLFSRKNKRKRKATSIDNATISMPTNNLSDDDCVICEPPPKLKKNKRKRTILAQEEHIVLSDEGDVTEQIQVAEKSSRKKAKGDVDQSDEAVVLSDDEHDILKPGYTRIQHVNYDYKAIKEELKKSGALQKSTLYEKFSSSPCCPPGLRIPRQDQQNLHSDSRTKYNMGPVASYILEMMTKPPFVGTNLLDIVGFPNHIVPLDRQ